MLCFVSFLSLRGDFLCTFCRSIANPEIEYCDESKRVKGDQSLGPEDQRVSAAKTPSDDFFMMLTRHVTQSFSVCRDANGSSCIFSVMSSAWALENPFQAL